MSENLKQDIAMLLSNTVRLICFTILAIVFGKWWIVLFVIIFWSVKEEENDDKA